MKIYKVHLFLIIGFISAPVFSQSDIGPLKIFGYFQNSFQHELQKEGIGYRDEANSFVLQQLNVFFQKDIDASWRAFVNLEFLNNFSSSRQWGSANLEEAWLRYRKNEKLNLKFGLLVPTFNNLNEIKNRTPLLPYIIRPIVYETSFKEFFNVEEFTPGRAFMQVYGFFPLSDNTKFDYSVYLGNSPNVNSDPERGQTGVDTTTTFLAGGRIGIRYKELKIGFSVSRDNDSQLIGVLDERVGFGLNSENPSRFLEVPRVRYGNDLQFNYGRFSLEGETIIYRLANESEADIERFFYYATLGYQFNEQLYAYGSFWYAVEKFQLYEDDIERLRFKIPTFGLAYYLNDRIRLKAQFAYARIEYKVPSYDANQEQEIQEFNPPSTNHSALSGKSDTYFYGIGASVFF